MQKTGESTGNEAIRLNHNRRQREDDPDQDDLESGVFLNYHFQIIIQQSWSFRYNIDDDEEEDKTPLYFFLAAFGLEEFIGPFVKEKFDLDSLMLVNEADLISMNIPLAYRRKLLKAINDRKAAIENPDEMEDSHL